MRCRLQRLFDADGELGVVDVQVGQDADQSLRLAVTALLTQVLATVHDLHKSPEKTGVNHQGESHQTKDGGVTRTACL